LGANSLNIRTHVNLVLVVDVIACAVPVQFSEVLKYRYSRTRRASSIFESLEEPVNADPLFEPIEFYRRIDFGIPVLHFVARNETEHSLFTVPPKKGLEPIKWLRTINALNFFVPTQKACTLPNSTCTCIPKLLLYPYHTN
jgi:hypothetical protein